MEGDCQDRTLMLVLFPGTIGILATLVLVPVLAERLLIRDTLIIILDIGGAFIQTVILATVQNRWMLYVGLFIAFLSSTSYTMIRQAVKCLQMQTCVHKKYFLFSWPRFPFFGPGVPLARLWTRTRWARFCLWPPPSKRSSR